MLVATGPLEAAPVLGATPPPAALPKGCDIIHDYTLHTLVLRCVFTSLVGVDLRHFNLFGSDFDSVNLSGANLSHQDLAHVSWAANLPHVDFAGANLDLADLALSTGTGGENFSGANLTGADLVSVQAANANFTNAVLDRTDLSELVAPRAVFVHASMDQRRRRRLRHEPGWRRFSRRQPDPSIGK